MNATPAVTILTFAYNAEKYIKKCADSVLNQTFSDIEWIVLDNGSHDSTFEILNEYANKDSRVILLQNTENSYIGKNYYYKGIYNLVNLVKGKFFTTLDSDDYFELDFIKQMYSSAMYNDSDIVICGNKFIDENSGNVVSYRTPPNFSGDIKELTNRLPEFYGCLRPLWGKLFKTSTWLDNEAYLLNYCDNLNNGGDTFLTLKFLQVAKKASSIDIPLYNYLVRNSSVYHASMYPERYKSYDLLFLEGMSLVTKYSSASMKNLGFLSNVHINSLLDLIEVARRNDLSNADDRLIFLMETALSPVFRLCFNFISIELKSEFFYKMFSVMWLIVKESFASNEIQDDTKYKIIDFLKDIDGKENYLDALLMGRIIFASLKMENEYIKYSKWIIYYYISNNNKLLASKEIVDLYEAIPIDTDFKRFSEEILSL